MDPDHDNFQDSSLELVKLLHDPQTLPDQKPQLEAKLKYEYSRAFDIPQSDPYFQDHFTTWLEHALKSIQQQDAT